jgi:hypothetical protein
MANQIRLINKELNYSNIFVVTHKIKNNTLGLHKQQVFC